MTDFYDAAFIKFCQSNFEAIRQRRNTFKGKPDDYDRIEIELDRAFLSFYRRVLLS